MDQIEPIVIEKNVPIPNKHHRMKTSETKYAFLSKLEIGDSVELTLLQKKGRRGKRNVYTYAGLVNAVYAAQKTMTLDSWNSTISKNKKFTMRTIRLEDTTKGLHRVMRIWRIR
tara:strand:- start:5612 stop:5953 length:342 start_codon:yes stop_codon:yes gene_type:complete